MIKIATVFSGIGGAEQALKRLAIPHKIIFACDNGDIDLDLLSKEESEGYKQLKKLRSKKLLTSEEDINRLSTYVNQEIETSIAILNKVKSLRSKKQKKDFIDNLYRSKSRQTNFVKKSYINNYQIEDDDFYLDIRFLDATPYKKENIDLLVGGSPCQSFSTVGAQHGLNDTRGTLFYDFARIIQECSPKTFVYENVRGLTTHDNGKTLDVILNVLSNLNYEIVSPKILNAADYGIPQTRRRLFIIGIRKDLNFLPFEFPEPQELKYTMQDFLEDNCAFGCFSYDKKGDLILNKTKGKPDKKFILTPAVQKYVLSEGTGKFKTSTQIDLPIARTLMKMMTQHHRAGVDNYITVSKDPLRIRQLSDREALRLMGFPDTFKISVSSMQMLRQAGNSMVVDVMMAIIKQIIKTGVFKNLNYD